MTAVPEHVCLLPQPHGEHTWWYTSSGGGHMLTSYDESGLEKNQKQWHCPGIVEPVVKEVVSDPVHVPSTHTVRTIFADYWHDEAIPSGHPERARSRAEFDAWLLEVKRQVWDEGYGTGVIDQTRWQDTGIPDGGVRNPYGEHRDGTTAG